MTKVLAMILAGGRVDELGSLTLYRPKSAVPFGGMFRIIDFPMSNLMHSGIEKVGILLQYRSSSIITQIGNGSSWDMIGRNRGAFVLPPYKAAGTKTWYMGTADAIYQNLEFIDDFDPELVLVLSGDHIYKMDYSGLIAYHLDKQADLTAAFTKVPINSAHRFGLAKIDDTDGEIGGQVLNYQEKPDHPDSQWASLTIYLFNKSSLLEILKPLGKENRTIEIGKDIIPRMLEKHKVFGYKFKDYWGYARTVDELWRCNMDTLGLNPKINLKKWELRTNLDHRTIRDRMPTLVTSGAHIENAIVPQGCTIEGEVRNSVLFPGVRIEKNASIENSIVMFDSCIGSGSILHNAIIDTDVNIGHEVRIGFDDKIKVTKAHPKCTVIGQYSTIPNGTTIGRECRIGYRVDAQKLGNKNIQSGAIIE